jgi:hypothetical protein
MATARRSGVVSGSSFISNGVVAGARRSPAGSLHRHPLDQAASQFVLVDSVNAAAVTGAFVTLPPGPDVLRRCPGGLHGRVAAASRQSPITVSVRGSSDSTSIPLSVMSKVSM